MHILIVEDDIQLNTTIKHFLESKGYTVTALIEGSSAVDVIDTNTFDMYIIDINLPQIDGLEIVRHIREGDPQVPVIMITASLGLSDFQKAFDNGCSDYIKKPFFLEELAIRMRKLLPQQKQQRMRLARGIEYDPVAKELYIDNQQQKLRKKERLLLDLLLQTPNITVPAETITDHVWQGQIRQNYPLRQLVNELRRHFSDKGEFIHTEIGIGYRFETDT